MIFEARPPLLPCVQTREQGDHYLRSSLERIHEPRVISSALRYLRVTFPGEGQTLMLRKPLCPG